MLPTPPQPDPHDAVTQDEVPGQHERPTRADDPPLRKPPRLPSGQLIDERFRLGQLLGQGGMGVVYQAEDVDTGRQVALKLLKALEGSRLERFRREGQITAGLDHPNLVGVHSAGVSGGQAYLVYELVEGGRTLRDAIRDLPLRERVTAVRDAARGLGYAHARGVVHRDVKPENVLIDPQGRVRVTDFGLAWEEGARSLTETGAMVGTPHYLAPEQIQGSRVGPAADVWALGVVLYEALCGSLPFEAESVGELIGRILHQPPLRPRDLAPVPSQLEAVCLKALHPNPADRYPDADALATDLERALRGERVGSSRAWWVAAGVLGLVGVLLAFDRTATSEVETEAPEAPVAESVPDDSRRATESWSRIQRLEDPVAREEATRQWLARHADHGLAPKVRAIRRLVVSRPLRVWHVKDVRDARFVADDRVACLTGSGSTIHDIRTGEQVGDWPLPGAGAQAVSRDDRLLAVCSTTGSLQVIDTRAGSLTSSSSIPGGIWLRSLAFGSSGTRLVAGGRSPLVSLHELPSGRVIRPLKDPSADVTSLAFSPSGRRVAAVSNQDQPRVIALRFWNLVTGQRKDVYLSMHTYFVRFSPRNGSCVVGTAAGTLHLFDRKGEPAGDLIAGRRGQTAFAHHGRLSDAVFSADGSRLYSVSASSRTTTYRTNDLRVWSVTDRRMLHEPFGAWKGKYYAVDVSLDGSRFLLARSDRRVEVWHGEALVRH